VPQFPATPQYGETTQYGAAQFGGAPQIGATAQPPYGQYQPGQLYGQPAPEKKSPIALIIVGVAVVVAAVVFVVWGLINGFPWSSNANSEPDAPAVTRTLTSEQFRTLVEEAVPSVSTMDPMSVSTLIDADSFFGCDSMEYLAPHLLATAGGAWEDTWIDFYLFDTPEAAHEMGVALKTCWHDGSLTVDTKINEVQGITNYYYESANSVSDQVDNLAVGGNVALWLDTNRDVPFDAAQKAWENDFAFSAFPAALAKVK
jgi:hypothetical protein